MIHSRAHAGCSYAPGTGCHDLSISSRSKRTRSWTGLRSSRFCLLPYLLFILFRSLYRTTLTDMTFVKLVVSRLSSTFTSSFFFLSSSFRLPRHVYFVFVCSGLLVLLLVSPIRQPCSTCSIFLHFIFLICLHMGYFVELFSFFFL